MKFSPQIWIIILSISIAILGRYIFQLSGEKNALETSQKAMEKRIDAEITSNKMQIDSLGILIQAQEKDLEQWQLKLPKLEDQLKSLKKKHEHEKAIIIGISSADSLAKFFARRYPGH
jgi:chromosome segregation ATPase